MSVAELNRVMLRKLLVVAVLMFGFGFALVPIYEKICQTAGIYDLEKPDVVRNTQVDEGRLVTIEFDANTRGLPWEFRPLQRSVRVHPGQLVQVLYEARNTARYTDRGPGDCQLRPAGRGRVREEDRMFLLYEAGAESERDAAHAAAVRAGHEVAERCVGDHVLLHVL